MKSEDLRIISSYFIHKKSFLNGEYTDTNVSLCNPNNNNINPDIIMKERKPFSSLSYCKREKQDIKYIFTSSFYGGDD